MIDHRDTGNKILIAQLTKTLMHLLSVTMNGNHVGIPN